MEDVQADCACCGVKAAGGHAGGVGRARGVGVVSSDQDSAVLVAALFAAIPLLFFLVNCQKEIKRLLINIAAITFLSHVVNYPGNKRCNFLLITKLFPKVVCYG